MGIAGAMNEVATLKEAVAAAERNAAAERTEREKRILLSCVLKT